MPPSGRPPRLDAVGSGAITQARIDEAVRRILTLKFKLGLFDQPCMRDATKPCVNADAANAAIEAGRPAALKASQESITLLRNNNNVLPLSAGKVVVTGPSADSMTNQLGGWSVSWQGVFDSGHVCCMGPAEPDTTGNHGARRHSGGQPGHRVRARSGIRAGRNRCERLRGCGRREGLCRGAGGQPGSGPAGRSAGAGRRAAGHRQAGHRGGHRRTSGRPRPGREGRRRC